MRLQIPSYVGISVCSRMDRIETLKKFLKNPSDLLPAQGAEEILKKDAYNFLSALLKQGSSLKGYLRVRGSWHDGAIFLEDKNCMEMCIQKGRNQETVAIIRSLCEKIDLNTDKAPALFKYLEKCENSGERIETQELIEFLRVDLPKIPEEMDQAYGALLDFGKQIQTMFFYIGQSEISEHVSQEKLINTYYPELRKKFMAFQERTANASNWLLLHPDKKDAISGLLPRSLQMAATQTCLSRILSVHDLSKADAEKEKIIHESLKTVLVELNNHVPTLENLFSQLITIEERKKDRIPEEINQAYNAFLCFDKQIQTIIKESKISEHVSQEKLINTYYPELRKNFMAFQERTANANNWLLLHPDKKDAISGLLPESLQMVATLESLSKIASVHDSTRFNAQRKKIIDESLKTVLVELENHVPTLENLFSQLITIKERKKDGKDISAPVIINQ